MTDETSTLPTRRRRVLVLVGVLVAVLAALVGWGLAQRTDPRDLVVDYLDAIAAGDVEAANALATDGVDLGAVGELPAPGSTEDAIGITAVRVSDEGEPVDVGPLRGERYHALAFEVGYEVDGTPVSASVDVERTGGWWLWAEWRVRGTLAETARVLVVAPLTEVDVSIGSVTTAATPQTSFVPLYPGTYRAVPDPAGEVDLGPQDVVVADEPAFVVLEATPEQVQDAAGPALVDAATRALAACLEQAREQLGCEGGAQTEVDAGAAQVTWQVDGAVTVPREPRYTQNWDASAVVVATWTDPDGTPREQRFRFVGGAVLVEFGPDDPRVVADWDYATEA